MSMLDAFFAKGFKAAKCKTLLKLTIPRIKLLRNRREIQLKQMRRDIAKLLETGQEPTARIRVEHIIREENMMAAQEIIELFCELIVVRLPIIETQRDCPLDLKEAISTICFAAPRCSDLPELQQIQMLFASKYGREFVSAASELMPDCGVNRQVIELLSVRAPSPETKLKLLKQIAEEHELDWDPSATETEFFKSHEDLLNGPTMFTDGSKLPLPEEKRTSVPIVLATSPPSKASNDEIDSDSNVDSLEDFPQVPNKPINPTSESTANPDLAIHQSPNLSASEADERIKFENCRCFEDDHHLNSLTDHQGESISSAGVEEPSLHQKSSISVESMRQGSSISVESNDKQFLPVIPPSSSSLPISEKKSLKPISNASRIVSDDPVYLEDVLAAARDAAESAERAAAAARSAASLAEVRISEIMKRRNNLSSGDSGSEEYKASDLGNIFDVDKSTGSNTVKFDQSQSFTDRAFDSFYSSEEAGNQNLVFPNSSLSDFSKEYQEVGPNSGENIDENAKGRLPQRLGSLEEDSYFSYPNLFTSTSVKAASESTERSHSTHKPE